MCIRDRYSKGSKRTLSDDGTLRASKEESDNYFFVYASVDPTFANTRHVVNPAESIERITTTETIWAYRIGVNGYVGGENEMKKASSTKESKAKKATVEKIKSTKEEKKKKRSLKGVNLLYGFTISFGRTDNVSEMTTANLLQTFSNPDMSVDSTSNSTSTLGVSQSVLIGAYETFSFCNFAFEGYVTLDAIPTMGLYGNINHNRVGENRFGVQQSTNINLGLFFAENDPPKEKAYTPKFGLIFGWADIFDNVDLMNERSNFSFGITTNLRFGSVPRRGRTVTPAAS